MSKNITLSDELYTRLRDQAAQRGQTIESYLDELIAPSEIDKQNMFRNRLIAKGLLVTWPDSAPAITDHPPVVVQGAPLSRTVIEDRR